MEETGVYGQNQLLGSFYNISTAFVLSVFSLSIE
jgi:hypothetical protein